MSDADSVDGRRSTAEAGSALGSTQGVETTPSVVGGHPHHPMRAEARRQLLEGALANADERKSRDLLAQWTYSALVQVQHHFPSQQGTGFLGLQGRSAR